MTRTVNFLSIVFVGAGDMAVEIRQHSVRKTAEIPKNIDAMA